MFRMILASAIVSLIALAILRWLSPRSVTSGRALGFVALTLAVHAAWFIARAQPSGSGGFRTAMQATAGAWMAAIVVVVAIGLPLAIARSLGRLATRAPVDPARRQFLGMALPAAALGTGAGGTLNGLGDFEVRRLDVRIPGLPDALEGYRIGQITDVHVGDFIDAAYVARAVDAMNEAGCDLQVMTGDLIDDMEQLDGTFAALERCKARHGMLAILGNHEKWRDIERILASYERSSIRLLVDQNVVLDNGLRVVGVDYPMHPGGRHRLPPDERNALMRASAEKAFAGVAADETVLCLTHHPDFFRIAAERGAKLTLAGHTHGGQVGFLGMPLFGFAYEHMLGRYRIGDAQLYVSGGTGHWMPFRMGVPTEVTILTLRAG